MWCGQFYCLFCRIKKLFVVGWQNSWFRWMELCFLALSNIFDLIIFLYTVLTCQNFVFKNKGLSWKRLLRYGLTRTSFFFGIKPALVLLFKPFQLLNLNKTVSLWCLSLTSASSKIWLWTARHTTTCVPQDTSPLDYWKICLVSSCHLPHLV